jgi:hypothetical protein
LISWPLVLGNSEDIFSIVRTNLHAWLNGANDVSAERRK